MEFKLERIFKTPVKVFGNFYKPDGSLLGFTLEDQIRPSGEYIYGSTCIPPGKYRMIISFSNRFKKRMIQLINVRGGHISFGSKPVDQCGIRIHGGNTEADTLGCPLLGKRKTTDKIFDCKSVNDELFKMVEEADKTEEVYLTITNP